MELVFWRHPCSNFGDELNAWIWDELLPGWREASPGVNLFGVGTILQEGMTPQSGRMLVAGSGFGYNVAPAIRDTSIWDFRFVRGPRTARVLNLPSRDALIDPAALMPFSLSNNNIEKNNKIVLVPHSYTDIYSPLSSKKISEDLNICYVFPRNDSHFVINQIASAKLVIAESLHAAIVADSFRVPWIAV